LIRWLLGQHGRCCASQLAYIIRLKTAIGHFDRNGGVRRRRTVPGKAKLRVNRAALVHGQRDNQPLRHRCLKRAQIAGASMPGKAPSEPETVHVLVMGLVAQAGCRKAAAIRVETVCNRNDIAVNRARPS
jgi:hypothetical protein